MLTSIRNVKFYKNALEYNVYHRCLCYFIITIIIIIIIIIIKLLTLIKFSLYYYYHFYYYYYKFDYRLMQSFFLLMCRETSQDNKMAAFRESYSKLYELRSLAPNVPVVALTATATKLTRDTVFNLPKTKNAVEIKESRNKLNVTYVVQYMDKDMELEFYFGWLTDELKQIREKTERTIIYCQTIRQCGLLYATIKALLGEYILIGNPCWPVSN